MEDLINKIKDYRDKRNWEAFHTLKDLLIGLNIEVGELQELMLWKNDDEILTSVLKKPYNNKVSGELADIFIFLIYISDKLGINLVEAVNKKIKVHKRHYPIRSSKNSNRKYNEND